MSRIPEIENGSYTWPKTLTSPHRSFLITMTAWLPWQPGDKNGLREYTLASVTRATAYSCNRELGITMIT